MPSASLTELQMRLENLRTAVAKREREDRQMMGGALALFLLVVAWVARQRQPDIFDGGDRSRATALRRRLHRERYYAVAPEGAGK